MISQKMQDAINKQIQAEFSSAYIYLSMAAYCESKNLKGFANWLKIQHREENDHAHKLYEYLLERGGKVELKELAAPAVEFGSPVEVFEQVLAHERHISSLINALYELALGEKDYASQIFLQWFISEQVEEEAAAEEILEKLKMLPEKSGSLLYIDKELGKREG